MKARVCVTIGWYGPVWVMSQNQGESRASLYLTSDG